MLKTDSVIVRLSDQSEMLCYVARPEGSIRCPAIIVLPEAFGVNHHMKVLCHQFAEQGYVALSPEIFHRTAPQGFDGKYDFPSVMPHYQAVTSETLTIDLQGCYDWLTKDSQVNAKKIGSIGYCMGGKASFFANSFLPLQAAASYYGGGIAQDYLHLANNQHAPLLLVWGGQDKHIGIEGPRKIADELTKAGKKFTDIVFSFADHAFSNEDRPAAYEPIATKHAWALTLSFFQENLKN